MKATYISASNMVLVHSENSTSYQLCEIAQTKMQQLLPSTQHQIIELKYHILLPCVGCGECFASHRCVQKDDFNHLYQEIIQSDVLIIVSPHYAPIPAKLTVLLEKMEQITFLHWGRDQSYRSEVLDKPVGIISHGGGGAWALQTYKSMVNDTIANALDTIQLKTIPFDTVWDTGISIPLQQANFTQHSIFPQQEYDWDAVTRSISAYMEKIWLELTK